MAQVSSKVTLYRSQISRLNGAMLRALAQTAEAVRTDVVQRQVMPFGEDEYTTEVKANGNEVHRLKHQGGTLQNHATFIDISGQAIGHVSIVSATPYARRLYYHPEYHFNTSENPHAKGRWLDDYLPGGKKQDFVHKKFEQLVKREAGL